ncbi:hypothetical protein O4J56_26940 [Nocardiopsis sp. RSe5-2]|uniref:PH domain-containing protein n=1 Tax=Nocardiopsis endophytica TaxID=3018445 RepID=A0ABT4UBM8_9ACTN|nr:hypothetical protein [Nocardiopsis endophytica]MDA2814313.1 hypothetical protein [Nocardiopsis endophytica]
MSSSPARSAASRVVIRDGRGGTVGFAALAAIVAAIVYGLSYGTSATLRLQGVTALWQDGYLFHRILVLAVTAGLVYAAYRVPYRHTRLEVEVLPAGLGITERRRWWARGGSAVLAWDDVHVISARTVNYRAGTQGGTVRRPVLDVYLRREVSGMPNAARPKRVPDDEIDVEDVTAPAFRVRLGGDRKEYAKAVRELAPMLGEARPDLFPQGLRAEQWFVPPSADRPAEGSAEEAGAAPAFTETPGAPDRPVTGPPVTVDYRVPVLSQLGVVALSAAVVAGSGYLMSNPFGWGTLAAGLLALVLVVPCIGCALLLGGALWTLPRSTSPLAVRVGEGGLEFVRKKPMHLRATVTTAIEWERIQAIVTRDRSDRNSVREDLKTEVVDIFLRGDDPVSRSGVPGAGLKLTGGAQQKPDSAAVAERVDFPAYRLRMLSPTGPPRSGPPLREALTGNGPRPDRVPATQLRAALYAFRPDLCHGFRDLWTGTGEGHPGR